MCVSNGGTPDMATGPTGSCAASAPRGGARAPRSKEARMTIDFRPTLAYPRLHQWPPTFGGPFLLEPCKRFRDNRDEAYLSTEQPRARPSPRFSCPQGDGWRPQDSGQPPRAGPQETVGLRAGSAPDALVRTLSNHNQFHNRKRTG